MSSLADKRDAIRERAIGNQQKRVLLVEGVDDKTTLEVLLARFLPGWEAYLAVEAAGNKTQVAGILRLEPDWLGLVDKDEWDQAEQLRRGREQQNLTILPRFCMESYLIVPSELWRAMPLHRQALIDGGEAAFRERLLRDLPQYARHGALWHVVTPLWSGLRARGFKERLASDSTECVALVQDDNAIRQCLDEWDEYLDPRVLFNDFQTCLNRVLTMPVDEQLKYWVHGKAFWQRATVPAITELFGQMPEKVRRRSILENFQTWPADLVPLLERLRP